MTLRKAEYIRQAAKALYQGDIDIRAFNEMEDEEIMQQLSTLHGVGRWTAEMILLHSLQRPNVFSENDLVIRRSLMLLHDLTSLSKKDFAYYRQLYSPYGSVAMIYLWKYATIPA
jgi:DNA-3-methyladenine glycosylase II